MKFFPRSSTLRLERPFGRTVALAVAIVILTTVLAELGLRLGPVQRWLPAPSLGSGHQNFDLKLSRLDSFVKKEGGVDCIFLGPSTVNYGLNPQVVRTAYRAQTGKDLRCFNFGLAALNNAVMVSLVKILIDRYHPRIMILGTFPGQERFGRQTADRLLTNPWIEYSLGQRSLRGWLLEHSLAYRYFLRFCVWMKTPYFSKLMSNLEARTGPDGFTWSLKSMPNIEDPPDPVAESEYFRRFARFKIARSHLEALDRVLAFKTAVELAVLDMPIHRTAMAFFGRGKADYDQVLAETRARAERAGVQFWSTAGVRLPAECWRDRHHLNSAGANILSLWLEERLAESTKRTDALKPGSRP